MVRIFQRIRPWLASGFRLSLGVAAMTLTGATGWASSDYHLAGWVERADAEHEAYGGWVVKNHPLDGVRAILADPDDVLAGRDSGRAALRASLQQPRGPADVPVFRVLRAEGMGRDTVPSPLGVWELSRTEHEAAAALILPRLQSMAAERVADADGDGVPDASDRFRYDPTEWVDQDGDGVGDNADWDDDNDGMSDVYERFVGLDPFQPDGSRDLDGDGMSNLNEALAGTLANDGKSRFALQVRLDPRRGRVVVSWDAVASRVYALEVAPAPFGPWATLTSGLRPSADGVMNFNYAISRESGRFVRGWVTPP